jgi:type VI secretion system VasD/TssJ family lipoprotein
MGAMGKPKATSVFILLCAACLWLVCSCAGGKKPDPAADPSIPWGFGEKEVEISYQADKNLNQYDGKPHTILLCVYQMSDPNIFNGLIKSTDGLQKLLQCSRFDPTVVGFRQVIVQPGETKQVQLDRAAGAKWVGIAAGYYNLSQDMATQLFEIPVVEERKMLIFKKPVPGKLSVNLVLGPEKINQAGSK